jgi:hypothetical protein
MKNLFNEIIADNFSILCNDTDTMDQMEALELQRYIVRNEQPHFIRWLKWQNYRTERILKTTREKFSRIKNHLRPLSINPKSQESMEQYSSST